MLIDLREKKMGILPSLPIHEKHIAKKKPRLESSSNDTAPIITSSTEKDISIVNSSSYLYPQLQPCLLRSYTDDLFTSVLAKALSGDVSCMLQVSTCYKDGIVIEKDAGKYKEWREIFLILTMERKQLQTERVMSSIMRWIEIGRQIPFEILPIRDIIARKRWSIPRNALHTAIEKDAFNIVKCLLELGARSTTVNKYGYTPLHWAVRYNNFNVAKLLVEEYGAYINTYDNSRTTPLHEAVKSGSCEFVKLLAEYSTDVDISDGESRTPLYFASNEGHISIVKVLVEDYGACVNAECDNRDDFSPLSGAVHGKHVEIIRFLISHGANMNTKDRFGTPLLHRAVATGFCDSVKLLVSEFGADVNVKDSGGSNSLHEAVHTGKIDIIEYLTQSGADIYAQNNCGYTPITRAVRAQAIDALTFFVRSCRVYVNGKDLNGYTLLHHAAEHGLSKMIQLLINEFKANVNSLDNNGRTPLHLASMRGEEDAVELLVSVFGADVTIEDKNGRRAQDVACDKASFWINECGLKLRVIDLCSYPHRYNHRRKRKCNLTMNTTYKKFRFS
jgi:ankyrin repeat protein